jgi:hypothetical protein
MERDAAQLRAMGAPVQLLTLDGAGHLPELGSSAFEVAIGRSVQLLEREGIRPTT